MRWTNSNDGKPRTNLYIKLRVSHDDLDLLRRWAAARGLPLRKALEWHLEDVIMKAGDEVREFKEGT